MTGISSAPFGRRAIVVSSATWRGSAIAMPPSVWMRSAMELDEFDLLASVFVQQQMQLVKGVVAHQPVVLFVQRVQNLRVGQNLVEQLAAFQPSIMGQHNWKHAFVRLWTFITLFIALIIAWIVLNTVILVRRSEAFDPYPVILLNLFLSMITAIQAPIIMMSQNRQAAKDRLDAGHDYEVNLKAELEIAALHEKIDQLREQQWTALLAMQQEQIRLLSRLNEQHQTPL